MSEKKWPALKIEMRKLAALKPYPKNARTHSSDQVKQIANSMKKWGWTMPVLIDETDEIIAGHGRVEAGKLRGYDDVPCVVARGWTPSEKKAYVLADNQLTLNGGWNMDFLKTELATLSNDGFDLNLIGFGKQLDDLLKVDFDAGFPKAAEASQSLPEATIKVQVPQEIAEKAIELIQAALRGAGIASKITS